MHKCELEIERKYIIKMPDTAILHSCKDYVKSDIEQIYLKTDGGLTHRIRKRNDRYIETKKTRIDSMSVIEDERDISEEEYLSLKANMQSGTRPLYKTRHSFSYLGKIIEIDVYPEWKHSCIMETELTSRDEAVAIPEFIEIIKEVTGDKKYSNASMSQSFPPEAYL